MRLFHSLKSTHWVIWSSPLLLLVLVFTLTTPSSSAPQHPGTARTTTTTRPVTDTTSKTVTTPTSPGATTTTTSTVPSTLPSTLSSNRPRVTSLASHAATNVRHATSSSNGTASSVKPVANAPAESASSGVLTGQLSPSFAVADVPLDGPGTWSVATSAPATLTLRCENQSITVQGQFVIGAREQCQLIITPAMPATSLTWQLTPVN